MPEGTIKKTAPKALDIEIVKKAGKTVFRFKIDKRFTELYKAHSREVRESSNWPSLKFYYCPQITDDANYRGKLNSYGLYDNYGAGLFQNGTMNIAWIRTVQGEGEIETSSGMSFAQIADMFQMAKRFIKEHWEAQFSDFRIKGSLTMHDPE